MSDEGTPPGDQEHPDRIRTLFGKAIDLPESARTAFIEAQCSDDPELAAELLEMLSGHAETVRDPSGGRDASASGHQASTHLQPGQSIGPFKILEQLGEGGFGVVYLAEQTESITRRVAIKLIRAGLNTEHLLARFNVERQTLTKMDHPGIARVLDASQTPDGHPYFVMEYVDGENLTDYCDSQQLDMRARLEIFANLCDAVQHAHRKGIIHRDLKPGNILVKTEETGAAQPKVIDFGIAKDPDQALTVGSSPMGTYAYMPPEQADPLRTDIDTRADVYSLGVILYELLTGSIPFNPSDFSDRGVSEFQRALREDDPPRPSTRITTMEAAEGSAISEARATQSATLASTLRRELEWIPLKALRKEPDERYESAAALGEDVRRYLRGEALEAGPESTGYRLRKFVAKRRVPIAVVGVFVAMLVLATLVSIWFTIESDRALARETVERERADDALAQSEAKTIEARKAQARAEDLVTVVAVNKAMKAAHKGDRVTARRELAIVEEIGRANRFDVGLARMLIDQSISKPLRGHEDYVTSVAFSPDDLVLASGSFDNTIRLWDALTGQPIGEPLRGHEEYISDVAFRSDGLVLASGSGDNTIRLWDVSTGQPIGEPLRGHEDYVRSVAFSPDGLVLASGSFDNTIRLWEASTGQPIGEPLRGHEKCVSSVVFSPNGLVLVSGSYDKTIRLWEASTGQPIGEPLRGHEDGVSSIALSPDGSVMASGDDNTIRFWDVLTGQPIGEPLRGHEDFVSSVAFSPDGSMLVSGSYDNTIRHWEASTGQPIGEPLRGHEEYVRSVAFSPDGSMLASGSYDKTIRLWEASPVQPIKEPLRGHENSVRSVAFSPDGSVLASGGNDTTIRLWDALTGKPIGEPLRGHENSVTSVAFSPDGLVLASGNRDNTIRLWDISTGQPIGEPLRGHENSVTSVAGVTSVAFNPDGSMLASAFFDNTIRLWDISTGQPIGELLRGEKDALHLSLCNVAFSPEGSMLASGMGDTTIRLWDALTGQPIGEPLRGHEDYDYVTSVAFSPDGLVLASVGGNTIRLWDALTGQPIGEPLRGHEDYVSSIAFSPDGLVLACGNGDNTIRLWDVSTGQPIGEPLRGHVDHVTSVAFSPDGSVLASGSTDNTIRLWHAVPLQEHIDAIRVRRAELESQQESIASQTDTP